jgi:hypothetical protein
MKLNIAFVFLVLPGILGESDNTNEGTGKHTHLRGLVDGFANEAVYAPPRENGWTCLLDEQCASGSCHDRCPRRPDKGTCQPKSSLGGPCVNDSWCDTQYVCDISTLRSTYGCYYQYGTCTLP